MATIPKTITDKWLLKLASASNSKFFIFRFKNYHELFHDESWSLDNILLCLYNMGYINGHKAQFDILRDNLVLSQKSNTIHNFTFHLTDKANDEISILLNQESNNQLKLDI